MKRGTAQFLWVLVLLLIWEAAARFSGVSPLLLPTVEATVASLFDALFHGTLFYQALFSIGIIALGLFIGVALALVLALLAVQSRLADSLVGTLTALAHPLPGLAILPLLILWFGSGTGVILAIIVHSILWPVLLNLTAGLRQTPAMYLDIGHLLSLSKPRIAVELMLPCAVPDLLAGVQIGWSRGWRALISAEMVFGAVGRLGGVGWYLFKERTFMDAPGLFAGILLVICIGVLVEGVLFSRLERLLLTRFGREETK
ncbi:MAG TPA: ABC transporter permease subunit [Oscillospiraceae bacterium]|nr:ABC transporter permease subunit [Oscillospiraceae bacterium]